MEGCLRPKLDRLKVMCAIALGGQRLMWKLSASNFHIMMNNSQKSCSICGKSFPMNEFSYGNRENRSYCSSCDKAEKAAYSAGGKEAARSFREEMRRRWKR